MSGTSMYPDITPTTVPDGHELGERSSAPTFRIAKTKRPAKVKPWR